MAPNQNGEFMKTMDQKLHPLQDMKTKTSVISILTALAVSVTACTQSKNGNSPESSPATVATANQTSTAGAAVGAGKESSHLVEGTINGGGGKGVRCTKDGKTTVEALDLYEARTMYNRQPMHLGDTQDEAIQKAGEIFTARSIELNKSEEDFLKEEAKSVGYIKQYLQSIKFLNKSQSIKPIDDDLSPIIEDGCEKVQVAIYYNESALLVDQNLWAQMDWSNRIFLISHEIAYRVARVARSEVNSINTREFIGLLFSSDGLKNIHEIEKTKNKTYSCSLMNKKTNTEASSFNMFNSDDGQNIVVVFKDLPISNASVFWTNYTVLKGHTTEELFTPSPKMSFFDNEYITTDSPTVGDLSQKAFSEQKSQEALFRFHKGFSIYAGIDKDGNRSLSASVVELNNASNSNALDFELHCNELVQQ